MESKVWNRVSFKSQVYRVSLRRHQKYQMTICEETVHLQVGFIVVQSVDKGRLKALAEATSWIALLLFFSFYRQYVFSSMKSQVTRESHIGTETWTFCFVCFSSL